MIIVELKGGLGNQMFQYAAGTSLAQHLNTEVKFDLSYFKNNENRPLAITNFRLNIKALAEIEKKKIILSKKDWIIKVEFLF
jgi:hypothetical protein